MFWYWELVIGILTIALMTFIEIKSQKIDNGKNIKWIKERFTWILTLLLFGLAICFTATILLTETYANSGKNVPVPVILQLLQFSSWDAVHSFLTDNFLGLFCIFVIPMLFFREVGLWKSIQIALLTTSIAYFIPVITEHYWFFIHDLMGFREFGDLYENGAPAWFSNRIIAGISIIIAFFISRAQLPEQERLFNFHFFKRKLDYLKSVYKNLK
ncbi:hypothetical protein [Candidatus Borrarchaeum sp.]|uniref:hypothetical protein n=1 Tax=Candidatus Borrarchaeum sp. TaxID=2846742 RepID=UPI00257D7168|nr:hypothetical protein [Candidatus Borrarchaeum sp.]